MEEDMKILEDMISEYKRLKDIDGYRYMGKWKQALENLIKGYKELEEENHRQRSQLMSAFDRGFIHKSKVEEVIEELNEEYERKITEDNINHFVYSEQYAIAEEYLKKLMEE